MADPTSSPTTPPPRKGGSGLVVLVIALFLIAGGVLAYVYYTNTPPTENDQLSGLRVAIQNQDQFQKMADRYKDANSDLLADAPTANLRSPETLVFAEFAGDDPEADAKKWQPFLDHLAATAGKKVVYWQPQVPASPPADEPGREKVEVVTPPAKQTKLPAGSIGTMAQMNALRDGQLHISAFGTGAVTGAVNTAGFIPLFCPAPVDGPFVYEMEIITSASSPIQKPEDLKGKTIGLVGLSSNSGGRAGLVYLRETVKLTPVRDFQFVYTGSHVASIRAVAEGRVDAACVANDLLQSEIDKGTVKADQIRTIYKSQSFPPLCFGAAYDLEPGLVAKIKEAFATFKGLPQIYGNSPRRARFAPVDYAKDWAYVRDVDGKLKTVIELK